MSERNSELIGAVTPDGLFYHEAFKISLNKTDHETCTISVIVPARVVDALYLEMSIAQQQSTFAYGFNKGAVPLEYIQTHFKSAILEHCKELLLKFCVTNFVHAHIQNLGVIIGGEPHLASIYLEPHQDGIFTFSAPYVEHFYMTDWRYIPFRPPVRKNYKDIDRQVELFFKQDQRRSYALEEHTLSINDWVMLRISLCGNNGSCIDEALTQPFIFKLSSQELENPFCNTLLGKKLNESFVTNEPWLHECFSQQLETNLPLHVTITDIIPHEYFCLELFKSHFKLKSQKEMHNKMIEIFSYNHDISQRRSMVAAALKLLIYKNPFYVPANLIDEKHHLLLEEIQQNPDYEVYRTQKHFSANVKKLAELQIQEQMIVDNITHQEKLTLAHTDVRSYINLKRPKLKDFIYFDTYLSKLHGQEAPLALEQFKKTALREKTVNHIIYHLTKK